MLGGEIPRELDLNGRAALGERLAYLSEKFSARYETRLHDDTPIQEISAILLARTMAEGARQALLVTNGLATEEELIGTIQRIATKGDELSVTDQLGDQEEIGRTVAMADQDLDPRLKTGLSASMKTLQRELDSNVQTRPDEDFIDSDTGFPRVTQEGFKY